MTIFNDAQELKKKFPATFEAPSTDELAALHAGSIVKICADDVERFWVIVTQVDGDRLQGTINNALLRSNVHQFKVRRSCIVRATSHLSDRFRLKDTFQRGDEIPKVGLGRFRPITAAANFQPGNLLLLARPAGSGQKRPVLD